MAIRAKKPNAPRGTTAAGCQQLWSCRLGCNCGRRHAILVLIIPRVRGISVCSLARQFTAAKLTASDSKSCSTASQIPPGVHAVATPSPLRCRIIEKPRRTTKLVREPFHFESCIDHDSPHHGLHTLPSCFGPLPTAWEPHGGLAATKPRSSFTPLWFTTNRYNTAGTASALCLVFVLIEG